MPSIESRTPFTPGVQRLAAPALRALADVLPALYAESDVNELPRAFTAALAHLVPGEAHGAVLYDTTRTWRSWHLRPAPSGHLAFVPAFFAHLDDHATAAHRRVTGTGAALALSDFVGRAEFSERAIHAGFYRPLGLADDLSVRITRGERVI